MGAHPRLSIAHLQTLGPQLAARPVASLLHDEDLFYKADRRTRSAHMGPSNSPCPTLAMRSEFILQTWRGAHGPGCELLLAAHCILHKGGANAT